MQVSKASVFVVDKQQENGRQLTSIIVALREVGTMSVLY